ncbi:hypothetical protein HPB52_012270 [Rhipicephalus sanguineus]|uniref:Uncharacterized protein n=1 Tax=Rhipicephalus sanguineus TaxID=34632 RepID=A0A9D4SNH1_RHISA|nr:hypothetical protein HPB52_012270 [Rhipicephalus sanguineus]
MPTTNARSTIAPNHHHTGCESVASSADRAVKRHISTRASSLYLQITVAAVHHHPGGLLQNTSLHQQGVFLKITTRRHDVLLPSTTQLRVPMLPLIARPVRDRTESSNSPTFSCVSSDVVQ